MGITTLMVIIADRESPPFELGDGVCGDVEDADVVRIDVAEKFDFAEDVALAVTEPDTVVINETIEADMGGVVLKGCVPVSDLSEVRLPLMNTTRTAA